jgi:poly(hydroxyalkanoate) depolymerase family esterase
MTLKVPAQTALSLNSLIIFVLLFFSLNMSSQQLLTELEYFGTNPGNLTMHFYSPASISKTDKRPLVVVLHGCSQSAQLVSEQSGWNRLANQYKFRVIYPQQKASNNPSMCFNWYRAADIDRDKGECASIKQMVDTFTKEYAVDSSRIYITGLSAGAAMVVVMMADYPATFNTGAIFAGGAYKSALNVMTTTSAMMGWVNRTPKEWGDYVRDANPAFKGQYPKIIIYQGKRDLVVNHKNAHEMIEQWTNIHGIDTLATDTIKSFANNGNIIKYLYKNAANENVIIYYEVKNIGHALMINPGNCRDEGGKMVPFSVDEDYFSTYWTAIDFGLIPEPKITGSNQVQQNEQNVEYSVSYFKGSTYNWSFPDDAVPVGADNQNIIKLNFGKRAGSIGVVEHDSAGCYFRYPSIKIKVTDKNK